MQYWFCTPDVLHKYTKQAIMEHKQSDKSFHRKITKKVFMYRVDWWCKKYSNKSVKIRENKLMFNATIYSYNSALSFCTTSPALCSNNNWNWKCMEQQYIIYFSKDEQIYNTCHKLYNYCVHSEPIIIMSLYSTVAVLHHMKYHFQRCQTHCPHTPLV